MSFLSQFLIVPIIYLIIARVGAADVPVHLEFELHNGGVLGVLVIAAAVHHEHVLAGARSEDVLRIAVRDNGLVHYLQK